MLIIIIETNSNLHICSVHLASFSLMQTGGIRNISRCFYLLTAYKTDCINDAINNGIINYFIVYTGCKLDYA